MLILLYEIKSNTYSCADRCCNGISRGTNTKERVAASVAVLDFQKKSSLKQKHYAGNSLSDIIKRTKRRSKTL